MTRMLPRLCCAALLLLLGAGVGVAAEPVVLEGLGGGRFSEAELERGATIVVVWASWSPHCRDIAARVGTLSKRWASRARVVTVVFQEDAASVRSFLAGQKLDAPVYLDTSGAFSKKYAVTTLPGLLIFKDGQRSYGGGWRPTPTR